MHASENKKCSSDACFTLYSYLVNVVKQDHMFQLEHGEPPRKIVQPQYYMALVLAD